MTRLSIEITPEQHQMIKVMSSLEGKKIRDWVIEKLFPPQLKSGKKKYRQETIQAIIDAENGKNITSYTSLDELMADIKE